jgi:hypothetical protein
MVTMRMCWCVRSGDDGVICLTPEKVYFSPWLWYCQRISWMPRLFIMPDLARCLLHHVLVSCSDHLAIRAFLA